MRMSERRKVIGIWNELPPGAHIAREGIQRLFGFLVEGLAADRRYKFRFCVAHRMGQAFSEDLSTLHAAENEDWDVVEAPPLRGYGADPALMRILGVSPEGLHQAAFANEHAHVDAWIVCFPQFTGALLLDKPRATLLPDAIPFDFPLGWRNPANWEQGRDWPLWRKLAGQALNTSRTILTYSKHVARKHAIEILGCDPCKVVIAPHASPDVSPYLAGFRNFADKTDQERRQAADWLRAHMAERGWTHLCEYPFEDTKFAVISTQDRPTKNILFAVRALHEMSKSGFRLPLFMTARLSLGGQPTELGRYVLENRLEDDVISVPDLPRREHAALYYCAALAVHPSFFEGGQAPFPFSEAASVGSPAIFADGPHAREFAEGRPEAREWIFDPYDERDFQAKLMKALNAEKDVARAQRALYDQTARRSWADVAREYGDAALLGPDAAGLQKLQAEEQDR